MSATTVAIVSGASRGLGLAMALALAAAPSTRLLVTLSRNDSDALADAARASGVALRQIQADLSDPAQASSAAQAVAALLPADADRYLLINNAGTVAPIRAGSHLDDAPAIAAALQLNIGAAMLLTTAFLRATDGVKADRRIMNISSGAGRRAMPGWGVYCATKAALDIYTQVVQMEQPGIRIAAIAPGVINTAMQADIRAASADHFPQQAQFVGLHDQGLLADADATAQRLLARLLHDDFGNPVLDDIRLHGDQT